MGIAVRIIPLVFGAALTWAPTGRAISLIGVLIFSVGLINVVVPTVVYATSSRT